jgi:hypothetical protein
MLRDVGHASGTLRLAVAAAADLLEHPIVPADTAHAPPLDPLLDHHPGILIVL